MNADVKRTDIHIRDPFVFADARTRTYYLYGTTRASVRPEDAGKRVPGFDCYVSKDLEAFSGPQPVFDRPEGFWATRDFWAPELHEYRGAFYLFASFKAPGVSRGTQILKADSPLGPFVPVSERPVTPDGWESLDGTFYLDPRGKPWIVFCHEWVQISDGTICARPLTDDLSAPAGDPVELFHASDAPWVRSVNDKGDRVTDGPFLFWQDGKLCMFWSSFGAGGYTMGAAVSSTGLVTGPWEQRPEPVFTKDGGHGMLFRDFAGTLRVSLHAPNHGPDERPVFSPLSFHP